MSWMKIAPGVGEPCCRSARCSGSQCRVPFGTAILHRVPSVSSNVRVSTGESFLHTARLRLNYAYPRSASERSRRKAKCTISFRQTEPTSSPCFSVVYGRFQSASGLSHGLPAATVSTDRQAHAYVLSRSGSGRRPKRRSNASLTNAGLVCLHHINPRSTSCTLAPVALRISVELLETFGQRTTQSHLPLLPCHPANRPRQRKVRTENTSRRHPDSLNPLRSPLPLLAPGKKRVRAPACTISCSR